MSSFASECGRPEGFTLKIRTRDRSTQLTHASALPYVLIGSGPNCHVRLEDEQLAATHAYIQLLDDRVYVCDLTGSAREQVQTEWYDDDEEFPIGNYLVTVGPPDNVMSDGETPESELPDAQTPALVQSFPKPPSDDDFAAVVVTLRNGHQRGKPLQSTRDITLVGRRRGCKYLVSSSSVANVHCSLIRTASSVWVVDLASGRGTNVNGQPIKHALVESGSKLTVGRMRFDLHVLSHRAMEETEVDEFSAAAYPTTALTTVDSAASRVSAENGMLPAPAAGMDDANPIVQDILAEMGDVQRNVLEQTYDLFSQMIESQQQTHAQQLESMRQQNAQLVDVIKSLAASQDRAVTVNIPKFEAPPAAAPAPPVAPQPSPSPRPAETQEAEATRRKDMPPPEAAPEVKNAWVRGQLHQISEQLNASQKRGLKRLLGRLLPKNQDALR